MAHAICPAHVFWKPFFYNGGIMLQVFEELQVTADRAQQCPSSRFVGRQRRSASDCDRASARNHWTCSKELVPTLACGCGQHLVSISNLH